MATRYSTEQRLRTIRPGMIPFGSPLPSVPLWGPRRKPKFGNIDFLVLTLATLHATGAEAMPRSLLSRLWSHWRKKHEKAFTSLSCGSNRFFAAGSTYGTCRLTADGWHRAAQLVDAYAPEHPRPWTPVEMQIVMHPSDPPCYIGRGATPSACSLFTVCGGVFYRSGSIEELCRAGWYPAPGGPQFVKVRRAPRDGTVKRDVVTSLTKSDWDANGLLVQHPNHGRDCYVKRDLRSGSWRVYTLSGAFLREYATANALVAARWRPHRGPRRYFSELAKRVVRQLIDA